MARCASRFIAIFCLLSSLTWADDRVHFPSENENLQNIPSKHASGKSNLDNDSLQPRFLPFSASFTLSGGGDNDNAHSLSIGGSSDGISLSQSASQAGNSFGNDGSRLSASQSSSFAAGLSGISVADANSFNLNHPTFGGNSHVTSNSFALGQATSSAQGNIVNGQATSSAQSGVGSSHSSANSGSSSSAAQGERHRYGRPTWTNFAPNYGTGGQYNPSGVHPHSHVSQDHRRPSSAFLSGYRPTGGYRGHRQDRTQSGQLNWGSQSHGFTGNQESWTQSALTGPNAGGWSNSQDSNEPGLQISGASASSSATSNSPGGSAFGQSSSHSSLGPNGPTSWTNNNVQTSGNAQSQAQGSSAAVGQNSYGNTQASFSSGSIAGGSHGNGYSQGNSASGNRGQDSHGRITNHATGTGFVQGTANSGSASFVRFPGDENSQSIPNEFVRSRPSSVVQNNQQRKTFRNRDPVGEIITDFTDSVSDLFDI